MLFGPGILIAGSVTIALACLDRTLEGYGFYWLGTVVKLLLPLIGFAAGIYFIETNAILEWIL